MASATTLPGKYYDPEDKVLVPVSAETEKVMAKGGYAVGQQADERYFTESPKGKLAAAALGGASGATLGLSDIALNAAVDPEVMRYGRLAQAAHPIISGAADIAASLGTFHGITSGARFLGAGLAGQAGSRVAATAVAGGVQAAVDDSEQNANITPEHLLKGAGIGGLLGVFGEGAAYSAEKLMTSAQKGINKLADNAVRKGYYKGGWRSAHGPDFVPEGMQAIDPADVGTYVKRPGAKSPKVKPPPGPRAPIAPDLSEPEVYGPRSPFSHSEGQADITQPRGEPPLTFKGNVAKGKGFHDVKLSPEEVEKRAAYFREVDPNIGDVRLKNRIAATNNIPFEELWAHAQPEFKWPRAGDPLHNVPASQREFMSKPQGHAWLYGNEMSPEGVAFRGEAPPQVEDGRPDFVGFSGKADIRGADQLPPGPTLEPDPLLASNPPTYNSEPAQAEMGPQPPPPGYDPPAPSSPVSLPVDGAVPFNPGDSVSGKDKFYKYEYRRTKKQMLGTTRRVLATGAGLGLLGYFTPGAPGRYMMGLGSLAFAGGGVLKLADREMLNLLNKRAAFNIGFDKWIGGFARGTGQAARISAEVGTPTITHFLYGRGKVNETYEALNQAIPAALSGPEVLSNHLQDKYGALLESKPEVYSKFVEVAGRAVAHLNEMRPKDPNSPSMVPMKYNPPRSEKVKFLHRVQVINDPTHEMQNPTADGIETMEAVYPETLALIRNQLATRLIEERPKLTRKEARRLAVIFKAPVFPTDSPGYVNHMQNVARSAGQQQGSPGGGGRGGSPQKVSKNFAGAIASPSQQNEVENVQ